VHRDIKPENIMLTRDGVVKVADFGLARAYADAQITQAGMVTGTVQYLAPEQLQGEPADPRTDLYSLGIVAYEMLTGRIPFTGETPVAIAVKHLRERVPPPSDRNPAVPIGLDGWVSSMTETERELRPESAAEARRDLQSEMADLPPARPIAELVPDVQVIPVPPGLERAITVTIPRSHDGKHTRRRRDRWALGILFVLIAIGAAAWGSWTYLIAHAVDVPHVVGLAASEAQTRIEDAGLTVKLADGDYSTKVAEGVVLRVEPAEGVSVKTSSRVTLVLSLGPPPVPVPNLIGMPLDGVHAALKAAKLKLGEVTKSYSNSFAIDQVIHQSVRSNAQAPQGSRIDVVISKGPSPLPVPKVIGLTEEQATSLLTTAGFLVDRREEFSTVVQRGDVISQEPVKNTDLQPGQTVTITVSLGPPEFPMPNVVGMGRDAAVAKLSALGLKVDVAIVTGHTGSTVVYQKPATGTVVHPGDLVHIFTA
jgi:eukaryotic-like serine/threonine-protein kinase